MALVAQRAPDRGGLDGRLLIPELRRGLPFGDLLVALLGLVDVEAEELAPELPPVVGQVDGGLLLGGGAALRALAREHELAVPVPLLGRGRTAGADRGRLDGARAGRLFLLGSGAGGQDQGGHADLDELFHW